jgi:hypothetical protein
MGRRWPDLVQGAAWIGAWEIANRLVLWWIDIWMLSRGKS